MFLGDDDIRGPLTVILIVLGVLYIIFGLSLSYRLISAVTGENNLQGWVIVFVLGVIAGIGNSSQSIIFNIIGLVTGGFLLLTFILYVIRLIIQDSAYWF